MFNLNRKPKPEAKPEAKAKPTSKPKPVAAPEEIEEDIAIPEEASVAVQAPVGPIVFFPGPAFAALCDSKDYRIGSGETVILGTARQKAQDVARALVDLHGHRGLRLLTGDASTDARIKEDALKAFNRSSNGPR